MEQLFDEEKDIITEAIRNGAQSLEEISKCHLVSKHLIKKLVQ